MGWERKRGKIEEFNRLLRGATDTSFDVASATLASCPRPLLHHPRPRHAAAARRRRSSIGIIAHPLNRPRFDPRCGRVTEGYGILQPRVSVTWRAPRARSSRALYAGHTGVDPYTTAVSDTYQDLFGEGIFTGKGLYDVDAFIAALEGRVPENALLSHDLFEGLYARTALVTDVEVVDDYPSSVLAHARRQHRWVRGDWQILLLAVPVGADARGLERNRLPLISRWKILDNLRRSLRRARDWSRCSLAGWTILPGAPGGLDAAGARARRLRRPLLALARLLAGPRHAQPLGGLPARASRGPADRGARRSLCQLAFLAYHAWEMLHAIALTLVRLVVTQRRLLEWETAAAARRARAGCAAAAALRIFLVEMAASPSIAVARRRPGRRARPRRAGSPRCPFLLLWLAAPARRATGSAGRVPPRRVELAPTSDRRLLPSVARKTWRYFETFVGPEDHWLPPDNFQEAPEPRIAHRTSPTNIGMGCSSTLAAHDLGYIDDATSWSRASTRRSTPCEGLERHEGHLLNWYDTRTLAPLLPRYVSTVDSGNLAASLITLASGLEGARACAATRGPPVREGLGDTAALVRGGASGRAARRSSDLGLHARLESGRVARSSPTCRPTRTTRSCRLAPRCRIASPGRGAGAARRRSRPATATRRRC